MTAAFLDREDDNEGVGSDVQVGDEVFYVPSAIHKNDKAANGTYCFIFLSPTGQEMAPAEIRKVKRQVHVANKMFTISRPAFYWKAVITALQPDGTASLRIFHPNGTNVLEYTNIPRDQDKYQLDTWHN